MLIKDPRQRIGYAGGAAEILQHPWFPKGDELVQLENLQATAPIIPDNSNEINPEFFNVGEGAITESIVTGQQMRTLEANADAFAQFDHVQNQKRR